MDEFVLAENLCVHRGIVGGGGSVCSRGKGTLWHARREEIHKVSDSLCNEHRECHRPPIDIPLQHCDRRGSFSSFPLFDCSG